MEIMEAWINTQGHHLNTTPTPRHPICGPAFDSVLCPMIPLALVTTIATTKEQRPPLFRRQGGGSDETERERSECI